METPSRHHRSGHNIAHRIWSGFSSSRTQANLGSISFMISSTSELFFRTLAELSLSSTGRRNSRLSTKPVAKIVMLLTSAKLKEDYMIERLSTSKLSLKMVTPPLLLSIRFPPVTTSNGTILRLASGQCDLRCKIKETLLIRDLKPALNENVGSENLFLY